MKGYAITLLLAIMLGIIAPPSLHLIVAHGGDAEIGALDLCHSAAPTLMSGGEMPCISACPCHIAAPVPVEVAGTAYPASTPVLFSFQDEDPPKA